MLFVTIATICVAVIFVCVTIAVSIETRGRAVDIAISQDIVAVQRYLKTTDAMTKEHYRLAWSGENPFRVMALCQMLHAHLGDFVFSKAMTSDFYGQTKHLLKKKMLHEAVYFFLKSMEFSRRASGAIKSVDGIDPIDLEVVAAPYYALSKIPVIGVFVRGHAVRPLMLGYAMISAQDAEEQRKHALSLAIISSKLYELTGEDTFKLRVKTANLRRDHDENQLRRIAGHLRMTLEELYQFCEI